MVAPVEPDPRVEAWLADQPKTLRPILEGARDLLDNGLPGARQAIKWGYPTWVGNGNIAAILDYDSHVNLQFFQGARLADPQGLLQGTGKGMRHVRIEHAKDLKTPGTKAIVRSAWRLDQEGGDGGA